MGQSVGDIRNSIKSGQAASEKKFNDTIQNLLNLAQEKKKRFELEVYGNDAAQKLIPIETTIFHEYSIKCKVESADNLSGPIKQALGDFVSGDFVHGIEKIFSMALKIVLGNFSGQTSEKRGYIIAASDLGAIYRIDYYIYAFNYTDDGLTKDVKNVVLFDYFVSSVKTKKISSNTILSIIELSFKNDDKKKEQQNLKIKHEIASQMIMKFKQKTLIA